MRKCPEQSVGLTCLFWFRGYINLSVMKYLLLGASFLALSGSFGVHAQIALPEGKIGIKYKYYASPLINIVTLDDSTSDKSNEAQQNAPLGGLLVFYEKMFTPQFTAGIYGGQLIRQTKIRLDSVDSVVSDRNLLLGFSAKTFDTRARLNGAKYFIGSHLEIMNTNLKFENAADSLDGKTKTANAIILGVSGGIDYKLKFASFRIEGGYGVGRQRATVGEHQFLYKFDSLFLNIGIMSIF